MSQKARFATVEPELVGAVTVETTFIVALISAVGGGLTRGPASQTACVATNKQELE